MFKNKNTHLMNYTFTCYIGEERCSRTYKDVPVKPGRSGRLRETERHRIYWNQT